MNLDSIQKSPRSPVIDTDCSICLEKMVEDQGSSEKKTRTLDCSHIFHERCIGSWLEQKNDCPLCRTVVKKDAPKTRPPEKPLEKTPAVSDSQQLPSFKVGILFVVHKNVLEMRTVYWFHLNENKSIALAVALSFFKIS